METEQGLELCSHKSRILRPPEIKDAKGLPLQATEDLQPCQLLGCELNKDIKMTTLHMKHHILKGYTKYNPGPSSSLSKNQPSTSIRTRVHGMMFCGPHSYNLEYFLSMLSNITSNYKSPVTSPFIHDIQGSFLQSCT